MQDSRTTTTMAITALVLALAAMLAGPAQARKVAEAGGGGAAATASLNQRGMEQLAAQNALDEIQDRNLYPAKPVAERPSVVVPYLSHGIGVDRSAFETTTGESGTVVPYLSHGIGVDRGAFETTTGEPGTVVPYLSQGIGVDSSLFRDARQNARYNGGWDTGLESRGLPSSTSAPTKGEDGGFDWEPVTFGAGAAAAALLLAIMTLIAIRGRPGRLAHR